MMSTRRLRKALALSLLVVTACGALNAENRLDAAAGDAAGGADASCSPTLTFNPSAPDSASTVRAIASFGCGVGVPTYTWSVSFEGSTVATTPVQPDDSQIDFFAQMAGVYTVEVNSGLVGYSPLIANLNVGQAGGVLADYIEAVFPPATLAPPQSTEFQIAGGANVNRPIPIDPGLAVTGTITNASGSGVAAYVRFMPNAEQYAVIETFSASDGTFALRMLGQPYSALVVPAVPGLAPALATWTPGVTQTIALGAGSAITGTVLGPSGAAVVGASVQLSDGTVPSTIATTASDGSFSVLGTYTSGTTVMVSVAPPAGQGLPSLSASVPVGSLQVKYASTLATCSASGIAVSRGGAALANVGVTLVGTLASAGTVISGATQATASGVVQIATTTTAAGALPAVPVTKAPLSAVVAAVPANNDYAVVATDFSACGVTTIVAPALVPVAATITDALGNPLAGVLARWLPDAALALAGVSELDVSTSSGGAFATSLASGGQYDLLLGDPMGRAAPVLVSGVTPLAVPASIALTKALQLSGTVSVSGDANPVPGVAIQVFCATCTGGNGPTRPIAETATNAASTFLVAIPDPGTM
jgi:hypothetical protein